MAMFMLFLLTNDAWAMHIAEGILPVSWAVLWIVLSAPFFIYGLYQLKKNTSIDVSYKPLVGMMAAVVFIISCMPIPVPTAGTCSHPAGTAISAIILGPFVSVVVATAALLIQALFLAHGGLSTLGANVFAMGVAGSFAGYLVFKALRSVGAGLTVAGFFAGLAADWLTYLVTATELTLGLVGEGEFMGLFTKIVIAFIPTQLPLGIVEGVMTAGVVAVLYKKRPDLLLKMKVLKDKEVIA
jgi:cobalt/nickel transport system permease protein